MAVPLQKLRLDPRGPRRRSNATRMQGGGCKIQDALAEWHHALKPAVGRDGATAATESFPAALRQ